MSPTDLQDLTDPPEDQQPGSSDHRDLAASMITSVIEPCVLVLTGLQDPSDLQLDPSVHEITALQYPTEDPSIHELMAFQDPSDLQLDPSVHEPTDLQDLTDPPEDQQPASSDHRDPAASMITSVIEPCVMVHMGLQDPADPLPGPSGPEPRFPKRTGAASKRRRFGDKNWLRTASCPGPSTQEDEYILILEYPQPCKDLQRLVVSNVLRMNESVARDLMYQAVLGAKHCFDRGVFHRDMKLNNFLINTTTNQVKMIDFGSGDLLKCDYFGEFTGQLAFLCYHCNKPQ
ncbi:unnamed protein product [Leuciscus chuanchicus]